HSTARHASPPLPSWAEMVADGNFREVVEAAEARGIDATLGEAPRADVVALADAARYLRQRPLARRGLMTERTRFPGSPEARAAAFVLGTMADDAAAHDEAIRWYDTYLSESPSGSFAAEALGRKVVSLAAAGQSTAAAAAARQYLRRFPQGAHAGYARDLLSSAP
ncbi:MAG: tetratricopeptide repeat protein, partial [Polyangiaceae bacterium]